MRITENSLGRKWVKEGLRRWARKVAKNEEKVYIVKTLGVFGVFAKNSPNIK